MDIHSKTAFEAIKDGRIDILEKLLQKGLLDVKNKLHNGQTLLYKAVVSCNVEIVKLLFTKGADANAATKNGTTLLYIAVLNNQTEMVKILLENGADINSRITASEIKSLFEIEAVSSNNAEITGQLLDNGADYYSNIGVGDTALHVAARKKNIEMVRLLLNRGADVKAKNPQGESIYFYAVRQNNINLAKLLVAHRADVINTLLHIGEPLLHLAIRYDRRDIVNLLLDNGADLTQQFMDADAALHYAVIYGKLELVIQLIKRGATVDAENGKGDTPLHRATLHPVGTDVINILLNNGADIEAINRSQETPLFSAVRYGNSSLGDFLLDNGANINHKSNCGMTCLNSRNYMNGPPFEEIITLLQRHIIKRKSARFYLNKENLEKYPFDMFEYQSECTKEVLYLKNEFIYEGFSLFDLLSKPTTQLIYHLQISDMNKSINLSKYKTNCIQYYNMIYYKLQNAERKKELLEYSEMFFDSLSVSLPDVCRKNILSYLNKADLIILEKLFK